MTLSTARRRHSDLTDKRGPDECWPWIGCCTPKGYGSFRWDGRSISAHRAAWLLFVGEIADGLVVDHLCRNRACVNPAHLEPVTDRENILRGEGACAVKARKTHCSHGHPLAGDNLKIESYGSRRCRACAARANRDYRARRKDAA